ncbi:AI-2E family transporter [Ignavibacteriales bacterium]
MEKSLNRIFIALLFFVVVLGFYLLYTFSSIIIPLTFAFIAATMFQPITIFLRNKKVPFYLIIPSISIITLGLLFLIYLIMASTVSEVSAQSGDLSVVLITKIDGLMEGIEQLVNTRFHTKIDIEKELTDLFSVDFLSSAASRVVSSFTAFTNSFFWFSIYFVVFLFALPNYKRYLRYVSGGQNLEMVTSAYLTIQKFIYSYANIKLFINLTVGVAVYVICILFGVKFAFLWGFVAFLLHFIPFIGAIVSVLFPSLMSLVQSDNVIVPLIVLLLLSIVQMGMGNIVEPILMGNKLRLNTITAMFGLVFWGSLWGVSGLFLGIPMLVIFKVMLEQFPETAILGRIMGFPENQEGVRMRSWDPTTIISKRFRNNADSETKKTE